MSKYYYEQKKESFFANHVKLITFLIVVGILLLILGPIFVMNATQWFSGDTRPTMTEFQLIAMDDGRLENGISVNTITDYYACTETKEDDHIKVVFEVEPTNKLNSAGYEKQAYQVTVIANKNTRKIVSGTFVDPNRNNETKDLFQSQLKGYFEYLKELGQ